MNRSPTCTPTARAACACSRPGSAPACRVRRCLRSAALIGASSVPSKTTRCVNRFPFTKFNTRCDGLNGRGPQHFMRRTLARWADDLHRLADALADNFENLFPTADLADLSDQLWLRIQERASKASRHSDNPWHDWGWYRNVALSDDLTDEPSTINWPSVNSPDHPRTAGRSGAARTDRHCPALRFQRPPCSRPKMGRRLGSRPATPSARSSSALCGVCGIPTAVAACAAISIDVPAALALVAIRPSRWSSPPSVDDQGHAPCCVLARSLLRVFSFLAGPRSARCRVTPKEEAYRTEMIITNGSDPETEFNLLQRRKPLCLTRNSITRRPSPSPASRCAQVVAEMQKPLPASAYKPVPGASDLTDIDPAYLTEIATKVFGPIGFGWWYDFQPGDLTISAEARTAKSGREYTVFTASLHKLIVRYRLLDASGHTLDQRTDHGHGRQRERSRVVCRARRADQCHRRGLRQVDVAVAGVQGPTVASQRGHVRRERQESRSETGRESDRTDSPRRRKRLPPRRPTTVRMPISRRCSTTSSRPRSRASTRARS